MCFLGKADKVINLLDGCAFDILFITESRIDGTTTSSLFAHPQYRIIRRDRKRGGGGLLVYIRSNVTAHRQINFEPEGVESICLDVKGYANNWFAICACYRSPGKCKITDFIPACVSEAERMYVKRKEIMFVRDFNTNVLESSDNPNGPNKDLTNFMEQFCLTNVFHEGTRTTNCSSTLPTSFPGYSLYFEKVPWLRLVTCLSMPTQAAPRVGPQLNFVNTTL